MNAATNNPVTDQDGNAFFVTTKSVGRKVVGVVIIDGKERYRTIRFDARDRAEAHQMAMGWAKATYSA